MLPLRLLLVQHTRLGTLVVLLGSLLLGALLGCSPAPESAAPVPGGVLRERFPEQADEVLGAGAGFLATKEGFLASAQPREGRFVPTGEALETVLPARGDQAVIFRGLTSGFSVRVREIDASGDALREGNAMTYARPGGRSYWTAGVDGGAEEWLLLEKEQVTAGEPVAAWEVEGAGLRQRGAAVEVQDPSGRTRLQITAPRAYAEGGRVIAARLVASGSRLGLWVEASGEAVLVDPAWVPTGMMTSPRTDHTATRLLNGKVLVVGGFVNTMEDSTDSAELYDPTTGTWTSTSDAMSTPRVKHTATLLPNGKVLVAGGDPSGTSELYDPENDDWSPVPAAMSTPRVKHTATLLPNGEVLVAGGDPLGTWELYDPENDAWPPSAEAMSEPRAEHTATLLPSGKVLVAGGFTPGTLGSLWSAEIFDPDMETWTFTAGNLIFERAAHTATLLSNGTVLVAGGTDYVTNAEIFDPDTEIWVSTSPMGDLHSWHTATLLPNGTVLIVGGYDAPSAELFDLATDTWTAASSLSTLYSSHTATLLTNGEVLVAGGDAGGDDVVIQSAELYVLTTVTGSWRPVSAMTAHRSSHTATLLPNGKVLVVGCGVELPEVELYHPATDIWASTSLMNFDRCYHTATLLPNGKVLVTGGTAINSLIATDSAEIFDPEEGTWTLTADTMSAARYLHTATLLPNGKVLFTGGQDGIDHDLDSAEIFDPERESFTPVESMSVTRTHHTATLLLNGKVLVAGGDDTAEIFDPKEESWTPTMSTFTFHEFHTATLLPDGKVLVVGGDDGSVPFANAELFDPEGMGSWVLVGYDGDGHTRSEHTATLLPNGKVLVAGGSDSLFKALASAVLFDPAPGSWSSVDAMNTARYDHTATLLPNGNVLVAGGLILYDNLNKVELFDPAGRWASSAPLDTARVHHTTTLLSNDEVLIAGGEGEAGLLATAQRFVPGDDAWKPAGEMTEARASHTATALNGEVLVTGGVGSSGYLYSSERYDPTTDTWTLAEMVHERAFHTATRLSNGMVLVVGGVGPYGLLYEAELFDPADDTWWEVEPMNAARWRHTATLIQVRGQDMVLVAGGFGDTGALDDAELYDPERDAWSPAGTIGVHRADHTATVLDNGSVLLAGGVNYNSGPIGSAELFDPLAMTWTPAGSMLHARSAHTTAQLSKDRVLVAGGLGGDGPIDHAEVYDTGSNTWLPVRSLRLARRGHTGTALTGGRMLVVGGAGPAGFPLASTELFSLLPDAALCNQPSDCQSDFCVDAVCCNAACAGGPCDVCSVRTDITPLGGLTAGVCQPANGVDVPCNDGDACTQTDVCQSGDCQGTNPVVCDAPDSCHGEGMCDPATGTCDSPVKNDEAKCDDANACTDGDICQAGVCNGAIEVRCACPKCAPYLCFGAARSCKTSCESVDDCAAGKVCDRTGQCVDPPPQRSSLDDSGCALAPSGAQGRAPRDAIAFALLALGALATRRRGGKSHGGRSQAVRRRCGGLPRSRHSR